MNYCNIINCDIANGIGVRVSLFVSGCKNHCKGCFQPETWNFNYGKPFTNEIEEKILNMLKPDYIQGLTLLGGDPMEESNQKALLPLIRKVKELYPEKDIWCYTGYKYETLVQGKEYPCCEITQEFLENIDILVDGKFEEDLKDLRLKFRGSSNQRIIDVKRTLKENKVILYME